MWIVVTEDNVRTKLSGLELEALKSIALAAGQGNPLPEIIMQVVREVRSRVSACATNVLGDGETIPDELLGAAINRIRFELATRLPVKALLTDDRKEANKQAREDLRDAAACRLRIVPPAVVTTEPISVISPAWTSRRRHFSRRQQDGV